jgi:hypothetical protein
VKIKYIIYKNPLAVMKIFGFVATVMILFACNQQMKFEKSKWRLKDDMEYPYRDEMIRDLTMNNKLTWMKYAQLNELLGEPNFSDTMSVTYKVLEEFGFDIDPVYSKNLTFFLSPDSTILSFEINEWKK